MTSRRGYTHRGIYVGAGRVVHYAGLSWGMHLGPVKGVWVVKFAGGHEARIKAAANARYSGAQIAARARARSGEDRYRLMTNNCEHFCQWCVRGESHSAQVERLHRWPRQAIAFAFARFTRKWKMATCDDPAGTSAV